MKCPFCGEIIQDDAVFCTNCGTRLPKAAPAPAPVPAPAAPAPAAPEVKISNEEDSAIVGQVQSYLEARRQELEKALQENADLKAKCEAVEKELETLKADSAGFTTQIEDLKAQLSEKESALATAQSELDGAQRLIGKQEQEKRVLSDKIAALTAAAAAAPVAAEEPVKAEEPLPEPELVIDEIEVPDDEADTIDEPTQQQVIGAYSEETAPIPEPAVPEAPATKICPSCGSVMPGENKFCTSCGTKLP
ncbi:MAG: zinc-ribbon domain-containing protein [Lachnospiraceae bacterium]|nr:zinc-ribbon domain-containing protein [Lachnospiraceae bacterium]